MIEQLMNEYGYRESGTDDLLMPHVLTDSNSVGYGGVVESLTEGSWPFDQTPEPNGSTPMATLDTQSYFPEPEPPTPPVPTSKYMYFEAAEANSTVAIYSLLINVIDMKYSLDGETWHDWHYETREVSHYSGGTTFNVFDTITLSNVGDRVYLKGLNPNGFSGAGYDSGNGYTCFRLTGSLYCHGNAQSLVDGDNPTFTLNGSMPQFLFYSMFNEKGEPTALLSAPELPATTLAENCYSGMFAGCTSLTQAPELPATTLADSCYSGMFAGCSSLTEAPELPVRTLASYCYSNMFGFDWSTNTGCSSLTQAPELPATTLESGCYSGMFKGCSSLTEAPELPATTLASSCYESMFADCTSLNSVTCLAEDISAEDCRYNWLSNVSETGTFTKSPNMSSWTTGSSGIPSGWTVQDYVG